MTDQEATPKVDPEYVLLKLRRAIKPVGGIYRWWPFPLHTQQSLRHIFVECEAALGSVLADSDRLLQVERDYEAIWKHCRVVFYPQALPDGSLPYPLEHTGAAKKDMRDAIEAALAKEEK